MKYFATLVAGLALLVVGSTLLEAGSVDGRQRWSHKKTSVIPNKVKWHKPIYVPGAQNGVPGQTTLRIVFRGNEFAEFLVIGDGDADIDLYVYDSRGKLVKSDVDPANRGSDLCLCEWTPPQTQEYRIVLKNVSTVASICQAGCN